MRVVEKKKKKEDSESHININYEDWMLASFKITHPPCQFKIPNPAHQKKTI
jgi:hypothetical protein